MISRALCLMLLVIISSFPVVSTLHLTQKVMAQSASETVRVLVDDVIQALKANNIEKADVHLSILNQQLPSLGNFSSTQSLVKVLLDDTNAALKKNDTQGAIVHLELIQQQFRSNTNQIPKNQENNITLTKAASLPQLILENLYDFYVGSSTPYPIKYKITGTNNKLASISQGLSRPELLVHISAESAGKMIIELPRNVIDAKTKNSDSPFKVLVEGKKAIFQEITNNSQTRTLTIDFPGGIVAGQIEIIGSKMVQPPPPKVPPSSGSEPSFFTPSQGTYSSGESAVPSITSVPVNHQVSIVPGASELADKAFSPNPISVKTGDMVTWTNNDDTPHVVTSGTGGNDPNLGKEFDSSPGLSTLIAPNQTFDHKFDTAGDFPYFCQLHPTMVGNVMVTSENQNSNEESANPSINNGNSGSPTLPEEEQQPPSEPNTVTPTPEEPRTSGTDYSSICSTLQPVLIPSCSTLVNNDGSLTSDGTHAMHCIRNGILLGGGAALFGLPLPIILKGLSLLAAPTGCSDVVNMNGFNQLGNIGSLSSLTSLLP